MRKTEAEYWQEAAQRALGGALEEAEAQRVREAMDLPEDAAVTQREAIMVKAVEQAKQGKKEWVALLRELAEKSQESEDGLGLPELGGMTDRELRTLANKLQKARKEEIP